MAVIGLEVRSRAPFAGGHVFGDGGAYERLDGTLHFAVDPADPANEGIVDLGHAERGLDGRVRFSADLCLLQPVDEARTNGRLLLEVPNRGRKGALARFNRPAATALPGAPKLSTQGIGIGDGLLLNLGWTVAWCGWQWDVVRGAGQNGLIGFDAPQAVDETGQAIAGQVMLQWQLNERAADKLLADRVHQPYPAASLDDPDATLHTRAWPGAPRELVPRERWRFARDEGGRPEPDDTHVRLEGGFRPGVIYELVYTTRVCPVVGTGLLALRDCVSFLRQGHAADGNPSAGRIRHTFGFGSSQCGRLLRDLLHLGLNLDESGRRVFDALLINVAGARGGEFNHRYAQPSVITIPSFGFVTPLSFDEATGPDAAGAGSLLGRQRARGGMLKIVTVNTSAEYWNREASLIHTDVKGTRDVEPPEEVRVYHFAGTKHGPGSIHPEDGEADEGTPPRGGQRPNVVDFKPLLRAVLFNLDRWVVDGEPPPPSAFPRLADDTAARPRDVLGAYHAIPGAAVPNPDRLYVRRPLDLGPDAARGSGRFPAQETGDPYPWVVPAVDTDGNELAGIRPPDVAVPVATHTGWFPRRAGTGGEGQNIDMMGSTIPFAPDARARQRTADPRPSIAERYASRDEYLAQARAAAEALAAQRYLLQEDVDLAVQLALERYEAFSSHQDGGVQ